MTAPQFTIPHGAIVRCIKDYYFGGNLNAQKGWSGKVIARRVHEDGYASYLIKWVGHSGPTSLPLDHLELTGD